MLASDDETDAPSQNSDPHDDHTSNGSSVHLSVTATATTTTGADGANPAMDSLATAISASLADAATEERRRREEDRALAAAIAASIACTSRQPHSDEPVHPD